MADPAIAAGSVEVQLQDAAHELDTLGHGGRRHPARLGFHLRDLNGDGREVGKGLRGGERLPRRIGLKAFKIETKRRRPRPSPGQSIDDPRRIGKDDTHALVLGHGLVHRIDVGEVIAPTDRHPAKAPAREISKPSPQRGHNSLCHCAV